MKKSWNYLVGGDGQTHVLLEDALVEGSIEVAGLGHVEAADGEDRLEDRLKVIYAN